MPLRDGSIASMQDYLNANNGTLIEGDAGVGLGTNTKGKSNGGSTHDDEEYSGPSDSTLIARSLASKMRGGSGRNEEDDEPMTTAAVRELRKLQKEKVYSYTLIRVKFPDRVCIQGYFHLRHTILDVYEWVRSCLRVEKEGEGEEYSRDTKKNPSGSDFFRLFELYTSPPRCVLHPYAKSSSEVEPYSSVDLGLPLGVRYLPLIEAHLVPAALIHLTWGPDHVEHKDNLNLNLKGISSSSSASASASASSASICESSHEENLCEQDKVLGRYLSLATLSLVSSNESKEDSSVSVYPLGSNLSSDMSPKLNEIVSSSASIVSSATVNKTESTSDRTPNNENKPKWLKIGK